MTEHISIPLDIPDVRILKTEINEPGDYVITVESTLESAKCRRAVERFFSSTATRIGSS